MFVTLRFVVAPDAAGQFQEQAQETLAALAGCAGFVGGELARALDEPSSWCLLTQWASVGAYRRALSSYDVRVRGTAVLCLALPEAGAFEVLARAEVGGAIVVSPSDLGADGVRGEATKVESPAATITA